MKTLIFTFILSISLSSFGNYKWELERNLKTLSKQINALSHRNADLLTVDQLKKSIKSLKRVKRALLGLNDRYPRPVCSQESPQTFRNTFKSIKHFAYSVKGLEITVDEATQYAIDWTNTYPCSYSEQFQRVFQTVKRFAFISNGGLNMTKQDSIQYAIDKTPSFCGNFNFKQDFWASFKLARYEMDLPQQEAINFARRHIERDHFSCLWSDNVVEDNVDLYSVPAIDMRDICINPVIVAPVPMRR